MGIPTSLTDQQKDSIRRTMRQLWEEVAGVGFYQGGDTIAAYREALEFYASPLGWTRSRMEIGSEVMEGDSPCECDQEP